MNSIKLSNISDAAVLKTSHIFLVTTLAVAFLGLFLEGNVKFALAQVVVTMANAAVVFYRRARRIDKDFIVPFLSLVLVLNAGAMVFAWW